jgi:hypothetical protein
MLQAWRQHSTLAVIAQVDRRMISGFMTLAEASTSAVTISYVKLWSEQPQVGI